MIIVSFNRCRVRVLSTAVFAFAMSLAARPVAAQTSDAGLSSSNLSEREDAVAQLAALPLGDIGAATRAKLIALLETEGGALQATRTATIEDGDEHEEYGSYLAQLVMLVVKFNDPSAVRGLCLTGLRVNRTVQRFIVDHARQSLPFLDEAWRDEAQRQGVLETWGAMLASTSTGLSIAEQQTVLSRVLAAQSTNPLGFVWAAKVGGLVDLASLVDSVRVHAANEVVSTRAAAISSTLHGGAGALSTNELLGRTQRWMTLLCNEASGARRGACTSMDNLLSDAGAQIARGSPSAANVLDAYIERVVTAYRSGALTSAEASLLTENATTIARRL